MTTIFLIKLKQEDGTTADIVITEIEGNKSPFQFSTLHSGTYKFERM